MAVGANVPSPFPGMDPFLEHPALWPGVHNRLIAALDEDLSSRLPDGYFVAVEERAYVVEEPTPQLVGRPDVLVGTPREWTAPDAGVGMAGTMHHTNTMSPSTGVLVLEAEVPLPDTVREAYLEVHDSATGDVVTVVEVLSPANKRPGAGRSEYQAKRLRTLATLTHRVGIDLLRGGEPMPMRVRGAAGAPSPGAYRILVAEAPHRPAARVIAFGLRDRVPSFALPLLREAVQVELQTLLDRVYDRYRYRQRLDYTTDPVPPLAPPDAAWADQFLRAGGFR
jgi:hypothetical protein